MKHFASSTQDAIRKASAIFGERPRVIGSNPSLREVTLARASEATGYPAAWNITETLTFQLP